MRANLVRQDWIRERWPRKALECLCLVRLEEIQTAAQLFLQNGAQTRQIPNHKLLLRVQMRAAGELQGKRQKEERENDLSTQARLLRKRKRLSPNKKPLSRYQPNRYAPKLPSDQQTHLFDHRIHPFDHQVHLFGHQIQTNLYDRRIHLFDQQAHLFGHQIPLYGQQTRPFGQRIQLFDQTYGQQIQTPRKRISPFDLLDFGLQPTKFGLQLLHAPQISRCDLQETQFALSNPQRPSRFVLSSQAFGHRDRAIKLLGLPQIAFHQDKDCGIPESHGARRKVGGESGNNFETKGILTPLPQCDDVKIQFHQGVLLKKAHQIHREMFALRLLAFGRNVLRM